MCTNICTHTTTTSVHIHTLNVPNDYVEANARCKLLWWQIEIGGALPCMRLSLAQWIVSIEMLFWHRYHLGEIAIDDRRYLFRFIFIVQLNFDIAACIATATICVRSMKSALPKHVPTITVRRFLFQFFLPPLPLYEVAHKQRSPSSF